MQKLVKGVHKFQREIFGRKRDLFERLADGQAPEALFITCSDSRISPAMITQTDPGDIFILRNAGNIIPTYDHLGGEAATVEFAVSSRGLAVNDIVVCGHSGCGAMKALLQPPEDVPLPAMRHWLEHAERTRQLVREKYTDRSPEQLLTVAVQENVLAQVENLRTHPCVAERLASGDLRLHAWVYKIETGQVFAFDPDLDEFRPVSEELPASL